MSKAWAMAGLRVGLALAASRVVELMSEVKYPYNINVATMHIVSELLREPIEDKVQEIKQQRALVEQTLAQSAVVKKIYPSQANFLLVEVVDADAMYNFLIDNGIIVRNRNRVKGCEGCLRLTIGTPEENKSLLKSISEYEKSIVR
jgi:histidinol-phosphate aminotransferase